MVDFIAAYTIEPIHIPGLGQFKGKYQILGEYVEEHDFRFRVIGEQEEEVGGMKKPTVRVLMHRAKKGLLSSKNYPEEFCNLSQTKRENLKFVSSSYLSGEIYAETTSRRELSLYESGFIKYGLNTEEVLWYYTKLRLELLSKLSSEPSFKDTLEKEIRSKQIHDTVKHLFYDYIGNSHFKFPNTDINIPMTDLIKRPFSKKKLEEIAVELGRMN